MKRKGGARRLGCATRTLVTRRRTVTATATVATTTVAWRGGRRQGASTVAAPTPCLPRPHPPISLPGTSCAAHSSHASCTSCTCTVVNMRALCFECAAPRSSGLGSAGPPVLPASSTCRSSALKVHSFQVMDSARYWLFTNKPPQTCMLHFPNFKVGHTNFVSQPLDSKKR